MTETQAAALLLIRQSDEGMEMLREQLSRCLINRLKEVIVDAAASRAKAGQSREQIDAWLEEMAPAWQKYRDDALRNIQRDLFKSAEEIVDGTMAEAKTATVH
ncbi:hypothetical protein J4G43_004975 [Bradyrhizobium barranii subsp. barranii]|uniref:Uncharacterized protein n=1 Tax=Bradyrhizobium barranii subsp. barranii TaxID=2823807 RepID=A0A939M6V5_9BRAD|nr:hypothetical protein [Bradyrhizobium barranii]UEM13676.1 hypothetical protein J4G43_004975 [Bradyrhizobium barranii subsp. barranii]